jgi:hypothetical protein
VVLAAPDYTEGVESAFTRIAVFVPKLAAFLLILLIGYFVAKVIAKVIDKVLEKAGFDRLVERGGIKQALAKSQYDASDLVAKIVFYSLMLIVLNIAFGVFGDNPVSELLAGVMAFLPKLFVAIVIVVLAAAIASAVKNIITAALGGLSYGKTLATVASVAIITIGVFAALSQLEIAPAIVNGLFYAVLATFVGVAIVAVGGGGIKPMQMRWLQAMDRYDAEKPRLQQQMSQRSAQPQQVPVDPYPTTETGSNGATAMRQTRDGAR